MSSRFQSIMGFRLTPGGGAAGATVALDNLSGVAINASLLPGVDGAIDLGSATKEWGNLYLKSGGTINWANGDVIITHSTDKLAFSGAASGYTFDNPVIINTTAALAVGGTTAFEEQFGASAAGATKALGMFNATAGTQAEFMFYRSKNASIGSATVVASGDGLGKITWYGAQQTGTFGTQNPAAQIRAEVDGTVSSGAGGDMPGRLIFSTTPDASGTLTDRLILDALGTLKPNANDGVALGNTTLMFSDIFLAAGAVVNFNNGNMTITHGTATLTIAGGDVILGGGASASLLKFLEPSGSGSNFTAFKAVAQSADITYSLPPTVAAAGGVLTDVAGNGVLTWAVPAAGSTTPQTILSFTYEAGLTTRHSNGNSGGTTTATDSGCTIDTSATISREADIQTRIFNSGAAGSNSTEVGSPSWGAAILNENFGTDFKFFAGIGQVTADGSSINYNNQHVGFKITRAASGTANLVATQSDDVTENASSALTTCVLNDYFQLIFKINATSSVDYYWRKNNGALSSATNLTSNMASALQPVSKFAISNVGVASRSNWTISGFSYAR